MVNLFEQWNDMDFASTYEPIDWNALNDFANRARQDAKDNADMLKEKMKEFDTIYEDPNSEKVAAKTAKLNEVRSQIQNINLNDSPAMVSAQLSKYRNPLATDATNFNNYGKARAENVTKFGMTEQELQRVDKKYSEDIGDNSTTFQQRADYQTNLNAAKQRLNDDKAASSFNGNTHELAAITQSKVMTLAVNDDTDLKAGKRQAVDHGLASIGAYGNKSKWWDRYKDYIELDSNGNPILDDNGMAIVKSDFTGDPKFIGSALYVSKVTPNGVVYEKDKDGKRIPIDIGSGYDALVNQELYRDLGGLANEKQDAASARPTKGGSGDKDPLLASGKITWYTSASNSAFGSMYNEKTESFDIPELKIPLIQGNMSKDEFAKYNEENKDRSTLSILLENERHTARIFKDKDKTGVKAFEVHKDNIDNDYDNASQLALPEDMTISDLSSLFDFKPVQREGSSNKDLLSLKGISASNKGVIDIDEFSGSEGAYNGVVPYYSYVVSDGCDIDIISADRNAKKETNGYFVISAAGVPKLIGDKNDSITQQNERAKEFLDFAISGKYFNRRTKASNDGIDEIVKTNISFNGKMQISADRTGHAPVLFTYTTVMSKAEFDRLNKDFRKAHPDKSSNHDNAIDRYLDIHKKSNGDVVIRYNRVVSADGLQMRQINNISAKEQNKISNSQENMTHAQDVQVN